jgi:hypothetical protein
MEADALAYVRKIMNQVPRLSPEQVQQFERDGHVLVAGVLSAAQVSATVEAICRFANVKLEDPKTWYQWPSEAWSVVPLHHAQELWDNRQNPRVVAPFAQLLGTDALWVSMDRTGFKPPLARGKAHRQDTPIHWDADPRSPEGRGVQGMLYLTDVEPGEGGFECVPSLYRNLDAFLASNPNAKQPDATGHAIIEVPARAGDLLIWSSRLPHRGGENRGRRPRVVQYVSYQQRGTEAEREERVRNWSERRAPAQWRNWPRQRDPEPGPVATLTPLGRKLLGLE